MNKLKLTLVALGVMIGVGAVTPLQQVVAQSPAQQMRDGVNQIGGSEAGTSGSLLPLVQNGVNVFLFIIGAVAVVMIVWGGFKYVTSRGESADVTSAKNTILYAVVGLIVAILAYAIVDFVIDQFAPSAASSSGREAGEATRDAASEAADAVRDGQ